MQFYELDFFGIKRKLPITYISRDKRIANVNIVGDIEMVEKAGDKFCKLLKKYDFDYIVSPSIKVSNLVHNLALRFRQKRYIIMRKSVKGYMIEPTIERPGKRFPKHVKKLVLNRSDAELIRGKRVVIIDDVVSTGSTMELTKKLLEKADSEVVFRGAIFKQGEREIAQDIFYLAQLPILTSNK